MLEARSIAAGKGIFLVDQLRAGITQLNRSGLCDRAVFSK
jgi:hypothetical protein